MQTDPLADFLTQIRNATTAYASEIVAPYSRMKKDVANILKEEGYIEDVELTQKNDKPALKLSLKVLRREKAIHGIKRVSKPGLRQYTSAKELPRVLGGLGISIISTSQGVMSGDEARKRNIGGEILAYVW